MLNQAKTKNIFSKTRPGLGLLETVVAMTVLTTGIVALMSMVVSAGTTRTANEYATVGANLAREGIEVVVMKRNDNWIKELPFDTGMNVGTDYTFGLAFDPSTATWSFVNNPTGGAPNTINDALASFYQYTSGVNSGLMVQAAVMPATASATMYKRLVTLDPICSDGTTETTVTSGSTCPALNTKVGVRVTSMVQWSDKGVNHNITAMETIYDWR